MDKEKVRSELAHIMGDKGVIQAQDVVKYARENKRSAIREAFDAQNLFDDRAAANKMRIAFARTLIQRIRVRYISPDKPPTPLRVLVNLTEERKTGNGGYRVRSTVMNHEERCAMLRRDFSRDIESVIRRYVDILEPQQIDALRAVAGEVAEALPMEL